MIINTGGRTDTVQYYDKTSPLLLGVVKPEDTVIQGAQKSFLKEKHND